MPSQAQLFWTVQNPPEIRHCPLDGNTHDKKTFLSLSNVPHGLAVARVQETDVLVWTEDGALHRANLQGAPDVKAFAHRPPTPELVAADGHSLVYAAGPMPGGKWGIERRSSWDASPESVITGLSHPVSGLAARHNVGVFWAERRHAGAVCTVDAAGRRKILYVAVSPTVVATGSRPHSDSVRLYFVSTGPQDGGIYMGNLFGSLDEVRLTESVPQAIAGYERPDPDTGEDRPYVLAVLGGKLHRWPGVPGSVGELLFDLDGDTLAMAVYAP